MTATHPGPGDLAGPALGPASTVKGRLEFLDALRGIAALAVALQHGAEILWPAYLRWSIEVFRPGEYGVFVFFICSGFIIPASLEKYGSVARFWIGCSGCSPCTGPASSRSVSSTWSSTRTRCRR
jgi:hypothetical protein